jgi:hypothetical protein
MAADRRFAMLKESYLLRSAHAALLFLAREVLSGSPGVLVSGGFRAYYR